MCEKIIEAYVDTEANSESTGIFVPLPNLGDRYKLFGAHLLAGIDENGFIPVRLLNPTTKRIPIYRHNTLGT
jgi:hypothetical protein